MSGGRPPLADRLVLDAVLYKLRTSTPWYDLPARYPSWQTCYRRYHAWLRNGVLSHIYGALDRHLRDDCGFSLRQALSNGQVRYVPLGSQVYLHFEPSLLAALPEPWQLETVCLLLAVLFPAIRRKLPGRPRLVPPDLPIASPVPISSKSDLASLFTF